MLLQNKRKVQIEVHNILCTTLYKLMEDENIIFL